MSSNFSKNRKKIQVEIKKLDMKAKTCFKWKIPFVVQNFCFLGKTLKKFTYSKN